MLLKGYERFCSVLTKVCGKEINSTLEVGRYCIRTNKCKI